MLAPLEYMSCMGFYEKEKNKQYIYTCSAFMIILCSFDDFCISIFVYIPHVMLCKYMGWNIF